MEKESHPIGTIPSRLRTLAQSLGVTIRDQAAEIGMPHATLGRRLARPSEFTIGEALQLIEAANRRGATRYNLSLHSSRRRGV